MSDEKLQDREALEYLAKTIMLNTRDAEQLGMWQLQFAIRNIRATIEQIATLCKIDVT